MTLRGILVAALLASATPCAAHAFDPVTVDAASSALDQLLDHIVNVDDVLVSATANFDIEFDRNFKASGGDAAETRFPGITEAIRTAGKQEMMAILRTSYPELRASTSAIVGETLTQQEIEQANMFYSSPTGRKLMRAAVSGARGSDVASVAKSSQDAAVGAIGREDNDALTAFAKSDAYPKIQMLGPKLQQLSAQWADTIITREADRLQKAVQTAGAAHVASLSKQPGS